MKKSGIILMALLFSIGCSFATQERVTTSSHDVIKVTLNGTHKIVVNAVQNGQSPKAVKTLMEEVGGVSAINGAFFDAYSANKSSDMIAIVNGVKRSVYGDDLGDTRALFGFQYDGTPILATNATRSRGNGNWVNSEFTKFQYGLSMHVLLVDGRNVAYNNAEMNNDKKQGAAATKEFICSTQDKSTVYFGRVYNVTFIGLAEYIQQKFGCYDAIQLDAGGSTAIYYEGEKIAGPGRNVIDAFVVIEDNSQYKEELQKAITWMYDNGMTRYNEPVSFMANDPINREQAAKFFGVLAETLYQKEKNETQNCQFSDLGSADPTLQNNIIQACQMGLFQGYAGKYDPKTNLTNAQALAVLSRIVNRKLNENLRPRYRNYYQSNNLGKYVFTNGLKIGSIGLAERQATRGEIAVMIYKTANGIQK